MQQKAKQVTILNTNMRSHYCFTEYIKVYSHLTEVKPIYLLQHIDIATEVIFIAMKDKRYKQPPFKF